MKRVKLLKKQSGIAMVEWVLVAVVLSLAIMAGVPLIRKQADDIFTKSADQVKAANTKWKF